MHFAALFSGIALHLSKPPWRMPYSNDGPLKQAAASPYPLFALLLFKAPEGFTLRTLLAFHGLGDRSHQ